MNDLRNPSVSQDKCDYCPRVPCNAIIAKSFYNDFDHVLIGTTWILGLFSQKNHVHFYHNSILRSI